MKILLTYECGKVSAPEVPTLTYDIAFDDNAPKTRTSCIYGLIATILAVYSHKVGAPISWK